MNEKRGLDIDRVIPPRPAAVNPGYAPPRLKTISPLDWHNQPIQPRRWIVPGWIPMLTTTLLYGDGGLGKSTLALQLATATAVEKQWLGLETNPCKSLVVACEDDKDELHRRQADINALYEVEFRELENILFVSRVDLENSLMIFDRFDATPPQETELYQQIHNAASDFGAQLVVLDSLHDVFDGNEISRKHARSFVKLTSSLARDVDGAVVITAHPSLDGLKSGSGTSGSTAWSNACRSRLFFFRPKNIEADNEAEDTRILKRMKSNYAKSGEELTVRWQNGTFRREQEPTGVLKSIDDRKAERIFLDCLDILTSQSRAVSHHKSQPSYAPRIMADLPQAKNEAVKTKTLEAAMNRLFNTDIIKIGTPFLKPNRHPASGIVRTPNKPKNSLDAPTQFPL